MPNAATKKTVLAPRRWFIPGLLLLTVGVIVCGVWRMGSTFSVRGERTQRAQLGGQTLQLVVADTQQSRAHGLSGKRGLASNQGMLFVFAVPEPACFWMKDMRFDLDILWFDKNDQLIYEKLQATPASYPAAFCPPASAKYVVEILAGSVNHWGIEPGDHLTL